MIKIKTTKIYKIIRKNIRKIITITIALFFLFSGAVALWMSTFQIPDLGSFESRKIAQSTKIYDRTGKILLYDVHETIKRTQVPLENISRYIKNATVAIEDREFYSHHGINIKSIFRAILANLTSGGYSQGGSTITQQVVKNTLLTGEKSITRKLKEWVLALKLERIISKEQILSLYLNETPYGGSLYGVEEASRAFFGKNSSDVTLAEAAYIAAIPKAPTYYSPYGQNKKQLDTRKDLVLQKMLEGGFITQSEYDLAKKEIVQFQIPDKYGIRAPHFVEYIKQYLINKYGETAISENGYKVITTLDYNLESKAEEIVKKYALENAKNFNATNAALVAVDPKTGQILTMVGSRDYFDKEIDGNFNVTLANRQPGSSFKPFVYATAFDKGYTPNTVLFDLPTQFQDGCPPDASSTAAYLALFTNSSSTDQTPKCYMPVNYDGQYLGPMTLRNALAQSRNVPAIKTLYLAGIKDSIKTAKDMGITSLTDPNRYGLTLVLGGGEVSPLEMTSAYSVFANNGVKNSYTGILSVEDSVGNVIEQYKPNPQQVLPTETSLEITDILSDNNARAPGFGYNSPLYFPNRQVAAKTGTTNDYKDAWVVGYTPSIAVGAWAGNNDNTPMEKKVAGMIIAPLWNEFMNYALSGLPTETFQKPQEIDKNLKPILRGVWQGNETYSIDKISGGLATDATPNETREEKVIPNTHSILYWVDKNDPLGPAPTNPNDDPQFKLWEYPIQEWLKNNPGIVQTKPNYYDNVHISTNKPKLSLNIENNTSYKPGDKIVVIPTIRSTYQILKVEYFLNGNMIGSENSYPYSISFFPNSFGQINSTNELKTVVYDTLYNKTEVSININIQ